MLGPLAAAVMVGELTPQAVAAGELEVEALVLQNSVDFHKGSANMARYRTPVASHLGANRTPVLEHRTQQANNEEGSVDWASAVLPVLLLVQVLVAELVQGQMLAIEQGG